MVDHPYVKNFIDKVGLVETCILHCQFSFFFELTAGCAEMGFKTDPILLDLVHPVTGLYGILKITYLVDDGVCNVGGLDLGVWGSWKFYIYQEVLDLV